MAEYDDKELGNVGALDDIDPSYTLDNVSNDTPLGEIYNKIVDTQYILNRLTSLLTNTDVETNQGQRDNILETLNSIDINYLTDVIKFIEDENDIETDGEGQATLQLSSSKFFRIGETCLLLDPFDNYRIFTLYKDEDKKIPMDISDGQTLYIIFKQGNKEIRIPEYESRGLYIDRINGQVLFKITKKQATDILGFTNKTFYITRIYKTYDYASETELSSDEEVVYSGYWGDRNTTKTTNLASDISTLQYYLNRKDEVILGLENTIQSYITENVELSEQITSLNEQLESLQNKYDELCSELEQVAPGIVDAIIEDDNVINKGQLIDSKSLLIDYTNSNKSTQDYLDSLVDNLSNSYSS